MNFELRIAFNSTLKTNEKPYKRKQIAIDVTGTIG